MKKIAFAFDVVLGVLFNVVDLLVFEFFLHRTARVVVPLASLGKVHVQAIHANDRAFNWLGLKRLPSGRFLLSSPMSMLAAAIFWFLCLIVFFVLTRGI